MKYLYPKFQNLIVFLIVALIPFSLSAQSTTISTSPPFVNNNGSGTVTFNFQNTNSFPIVITDVSGLFGTSGSNNVQIWYKTTPIAGLPGNISTANGWVQAVNTTTTGTTGSIQPFVTNQSILIPGNVTYGMAIYVPNQPYYTMPSSQTFFGGGVNLITGTNVSYGGGIPNSTAPTFTPRGWIGTITFKPAIYGTNNAGVSQFIAPLNFCPGQEDIKIKVNNAGHNVINNVQVQWELNGVAQTPYNITTPLDTFGGAGINELQITLGSYTFTNAPVELKAWTTLPNGQPDTVNGNDTITQVMQASLSGTYTINDALPTGGTNYNNFSDFTDDLNTFGVCGPVVANVAVGSGPYVETVTFENISGASATNTIRVNGNGRTVQFNNTSTQRQLLTLDGAKYVTIDSLVFKSLNTSYGWGALVTGGAEYDSLMRCVFDLTSVSGSSSANSNGITFSASNTSPTSSGANGSNCYIANNQILGRTGSGGPYYGFTMYGDNENNVIKDNLIENFYYYGFYNYGGSGNVIDGNEITRETKTSVTTFYGMYFSTGTPAGITVRNNRIHSPYGGTGSSSSTFYGIYNLFDGTAATPAYFYNNAVYDINQGGIVYGFYNSTVHHTKIYHNTIDISQNLSSSSTNYGLYLSGSNTGTEVKNNIVTITGGGTGTKYGFYYSSTSSIDDAQRNNIYVNSPQPGTEYYGYYGSAYATMAAFQAANPTLEVGSLSEDPQYAGLATGNLAPMNPALFASGQNLTSIVNTDILECQDQHFLPLAHSRFRLSVQTTQQPSH